MTRDGDLVHVSVRGTFSYEVARTLHESLAQVMREAGRAYLLAGMTELTGISADARRYVGEWHKTHTISGVAVYGISFTMRALATLMYNAVRIVGRQQLELEFLRDEAAARRWIEVHRAKDIASTAGSRRADD